MDRRLLLSNGGCTAMAHDAIHGTQIEQGVISNVYA